MKPTVSAQFDTVLYNKLRNTRMGRLARFAQVAQVPLAVVPPARPYSEAERGDRLKVHTTVPGNQQPQVVPDANGAGLFLLVVGSDSYSTYSLPQDGSVSIGRGETNQVRIDDPLASRNVISPRRKSASCFVTTRRARRSRKLRGTATV